MQDRLVKELRLAGIATIAAANVWLPGFVEAHNKRFVRARECQGIPSLDNCR